jgi:glycosyltransferase involved in cell wall biosynthesis
MMTRPPAAAPAGKGEVTASMRRSMRILMVAQSYAPVVGGEERIVEDLSVELARRGHTVAVATLRQPVGEPPQRDEVAVHTLDGLLRKIPGIPLDPERQYAPPGPDPLSVRGLREVLGKMEPDVVHGHNWLADSYLPLDRAAGPAFVLSLHDYSLLCATKRFFYRGGACSGPGPRKCLAHSLSYYGAAKGTMVAVGTAVSDRWLRRRVDLFLPVSGAVRDLSRLGPEDRHRVVPNFVGELPAAPSLPDPRLEALPREPFILYFGDLTEDKGVGVLAEAYSRLGQAPPLVLVGRKLIDLPPTPGLIEMGRLPHALAVEVLRRSLFTVAPTILPESFGIVALEAAAAGKPAIVSEIGGLKDVVVDGETGFLVPPGDATALQIALQRLCEDAELRARMGVAASERAKLFGPDAVVPQFEAAYRAAIEIRAARSGSQSAAPNGG